MTSAASPPRPVPFQGDLRNLPDGARAAEGAAELGVLALRMERRQEGRRQMDQAAVSAEQPAATTRRTTTHRPGAPMSRRLAAFEAGQCDGIGFNLSGTDIAAFDIDKCRDPATGDIAPEAMAIVDRATSYTEMTVSGTGLRVIGYGTGPKVHRKQKLPGSAVEVESYRNAERYIVITGNPLPETWPHMADIDDVIDAVVAELDGQRRRRRKTTNSLSSPKPGMETAGDTGDAFLPGDLDRTHREGRSATGRPERRVSSCRLLACRLWLVGGAHRGPHCRQANRSRALCKAAGARKSPAACTRAKTKEQTEARERRVQGPRSDAHASRPATQPFELFWHGKDYDRARRSWLVKELIPETGQGLASGQWGTAKTFVVLDLAASIMTATPFAGREIGRHGGVVFVAAEGASEIPIRLEGVVEQKLRPEASRARHRTTRLRRPGVAAVCLDRGLPESAR